jgi:predicted acylesterase/phospholipase RssA/CRP-like cAMP-binding protein
VALRDDHVDALTALGVVRRIEPLDALVVAGEEGDEVFVVLAGRLAAYRPDPAGDLLLAEMGRGDLVGEVAGITRSRRTATVRALEPTEVVAVTRAAFDGWLANAPDVADELAAETRRRLDRSQVAVFAVGLVGEHDTVLVQAITHRVSWVALDAGATLFRHGDPPDAAYVVLSGRLLVTVPGLVPGGPPAVRREVGQGELVGELELIDRSVRSGTVEAIRDTRLARFSAADFDALVTEHPRLALHVARGILRRVEERTPGPDRPRAVTVAVTAPLDGPAFVGGMARALAGCADVLHLSAERVDGLLGSTGSAQVGPDEPGGRRLWELLYEADARHDHVLYEADPEPTAWTRRVMRQADRIVVVVSSRPGVEEDRRTRALLARSAGITRVKRWLAVVHPEGTERPQGTTALLDRYRADEAIHVRAGVPGDLARLARLATGRGVGLVLGGGGARGFAHLGVHRALRELGVPIDRIAGASVGAPLGAGMALDVDPDELLAAVTTQFAGVLDYTIPVVALVKGERIAANLRGIFDGRAIEDLWLPFLCVSTNLTRSRVEVHRRGDLSAAIRASIAIPGVLPPVASGDDLLVDGGVLNNLPVDVLRDDSSVGTVIGVDVSPAVGPRARADHGLSVSGWKALRAQLGRGRSSYPGISAVLMRTMVVGSMREREAHLRDGVMDLHLHLDADLRGVGLLDFDTVAPVADAGYQAVRPRLEEWIAGFGTVRPWGHPVGDG